MKRRRLYLPYNDALVLRRVGFFLIKSVRASWEVRKLINVICRNDFVRELSLDNDGGCVDFTDCRDGLQLNGCRLHELLMRIGEPTSIFS